MPSSCSPISGISQAYKTVTSHVAKGTKSVLDALDIPQFPVEGAVFGHGHWEQCHVYKERREWKQIHVRITKQKGNFFHGTFWRSVPQEVKKLGAKLVDPVEPASQGAGKTYWLVVKNDTDVNTIVGQIKDLDCVLNIQLAGDEQPNLMWQQRVLHDKSTGLIFDGLGNNIFILRGKGLVIAAVTPIYAVATIIYNLIRIIGVTLYLALRILYEYARREDGVTFKSIAKARCKDMGVQTWCSIRNIIRTPFFAIGFFFSNLYMIVDPYNGMKMGGCFEHHWNHRLPIEKGWWFFPQRDFKFEGGGKPENLGQSTFYLAGCLAPIARTISTEEGYDLAYLPETDEEEDDPIIKEGHKVYRYSSEWFITFPFCCPFSFPNDGSVTS